jgi:polyferredoxin
MSDESTVTILVLIGAIFQIIIGILLLLGGAGSSIGTAIDFIFWGVSSPFDWLWVFVPGVPLMVLGILGLFFGLNWLRWRHTPMDYKQQLILTGILALIFAGFIPGLLVLIAGAIIPEEAA